MATPFKDDDFLCEKCRYVLNGLGPEANCSECGKPAYESHPSHLAGRSMDAPKSVVDSIVFAVRVLRRPFWMTRHSFSWSTKSLLGTLPVIGLSGVVVGLSSFILITLFSIRIHPGHYHTESESGMLYEDILGAAFFLTLAYIVIATALAVILAASVWGLSKSLTWRVTFARAFVIALSGIVSLSLILIVTHLLALLLFGFGVLRYWMSMSYYEIEGLFVVLVLFLPFALLLCGVGFVAIMVWVSRYVNPPEAAPPWSIEDALRARGLKEAVSHEPSGD